jgi:hypothetical protein
MPYFAWEGPYTGKHPLIILYGPSAFLNVLGEAFLVG